MGTFKGSLLVSLVSILAIAGCGTSSVDPMFTPMGGNADVMAMHSASPDGTLYPQPTLEDRTVIQLLTSTIINNAPNQLLQFKVSYEGANGNPVDFPFDELLFDIASINASGASSLDYTIEISNAAGYSGAIAPVWGEDLFGNLGRNYYHYATDQTLNIAAGVRWFIFTVDLSYTVNHPYGSVGTPPAQESIPVYVRFGHESMAAMAPVTFVNQ